MELAVGKDEQKALANGARRLAAGAEENRGLELLEGVRGRGLSAVRRLHHH
jgi:hypothetical protein